MYVNGEKRRANRIPLFLKLELSSLFKQDNVKINLDMTPIEVTDISKTGIGFVSSSVLPLNYYFNAKLCLRDESSSLYCVLQIVRTQSLDAKMTKYGCEFVGFPPILNYIIDEYEEKYNKSVK